MAEQSGPGALQILLDQFKSVVILILVAAAVLAFGFQHATEGIAIVAVLVVNTALGFVTEWRAARSMEALREMGGDKIRVRRQDEEIEIDAEALVPGDLIIIESGDFVPADIRIIEANNLRAKESALTGESVSVQKQEQPVAEDAPLAERASMLYKGTMVADGSGKGIVTATGGDTELGHISELAERAESDSTPLQKRLNSLGNRLAWITIAIAVIIAIAGLLAGKEPRIIIETAIALGVAAIPEGLPIVATIALARGMYLMARRNALINKLPAVETLGATQVIFTDKTGTLTENKMTLRELHHSGGAWEMDEEIREPDSDLARRILEVGVLCNNASLVDRDDDLIPEEEQGDPTETALLRAGLQIGMKREELLEAKPELKEVPFDSDRMMMATYHQDEDQIEIAVKGAPDRLIAQCSRIAVSVEESEEMTDEQRQQWRTKSDELAREGLRILALAEKRVSSEEESPFQELTFLGLVGLFDPPREDVAASIRECQQAGIDVVMVTGDQPATAQAIAEATEISDGSETAIHGNQLNSSGSENGRQDHSATDSHIFARVSPEQKLDLVAMFQKKGNTVAMTGDGVNDTPALKKADIGIAMGRRGTDAAKQTADMVLLDDAFSSIVTAVRYGRIIFQNIRKSVLFMLCTNVAEVIAVALSVLIGAFVLFPVPLLPLQILYLNVITDVLPALALGMVEGEPGIMKRDPRPRDEQILTRTHWLAIGGWSTLISFCVLVALAVALHLLGFEQQRAVTVSFLTLAFAKLWFTFNLRAESSTLFNNAIIRNHWVLGATAICIVLLLLAVYLPFLAGLLQTSDPGAAGWTLILAASFIPFLVGQLRMVIRKP